MITLFAALSLTAAPAAHPPVNFTDLLSFADAQIRNHCRDGLTKAAGDHAASFYRLKDLPDANEEIAMVRVDRTTGCQKPVIVSFKVSR